MTTIVHISLFSHPRGHGTTKYASCLPKTVCSVCVLCLQRIQHTAHTEERAREEEEEGIERGLQIYPSGICALHQTVLHTDSHTATRRVLSGKLFGIFVQNNRDCNCKLFVQTKVNVHNAYEMADRMLNTTAVAVKLKAKLSHSHLEDK